MTLLVEDFGTGELLRICLAWIDNAMGVRPDERYVVELCCHDLTTGAAMDIEDTPPSARWAARFIAARVADDSLTAEALWKSGTDEQFIDGVVALLGICGTYLALQYGITAPGNLQDRPRRHRR